MSTINKKKIIQVFLSQVVFFILLFCIKFIYYPQDYIGVERFFYVQSDIEITLEILFLLGLSLGMCYYILKSNNMINSSIWMGLSLCFLFEISKYVEHLLGFLPNYGDVPIIISILLSFVVISLYMSVLYVICLFLKKIKCRIKNTYKHSIHLYVINIQHGWSIINKNKLIQVIFFQIVYFIFLFCLKLIFHTRYDTSVERAIHIQSNVEIILELLFLLGISSVMCRYILKSVNEILVSICMGLSFIFLLHVSNYIEHLLGFLPNYGDVPIIISILLSFVVISLYMSVLYVICLFLKKIKCRKKLHKTPINVQNICI